MSRSCSSLQTAFRKVTHVIFDMDGLLLDTETLYTEATQNIIGKYGKEFTWDVKCILMGLSGAESARKLIEIYELPLTCEELVALFNEQYVQLMPHAVLMPDTEGTYFRVVSNILARHGARHSPELRVKILGLQPRDYFQAIINDARLKMSWEDMLNQFRPEFFALACNATVMPGAARLVKHLHSHNVPCCVATSSSFESYSIKTQNHKDLFGLFEHIVTGGSDPEVKAGKPSPDIFKIAAARFQSQPKREDCLVFEDAPNGVTAAIAAGMQCVMVPDEHVATDLCKNATLILQNLKEFKPEQFCLPPFPNECTC